MLYPFIFANIYVTDQQPFRLPTGYIFYSKGLVHMLRFLGRGSGFTTQHNNAFFTDGKELILIDCAMTSFFRLMQTPREKLTPSGPADRITVIVTHTHGDHVGGIPMLILYAYYVWHIPVTVAAPSEEVLTDLRYLIERLEGCRSDAYTPVLAGTLTKWVKAVIPTEHARELSGRCFGYLLCIDGQQIIYTGDTRTLEPFKPYLDRAEQLFTDASSRASEVHLCLADNIEYLDRLTQNGMEVYVMHMDNEALIGEMIKDTGLRMAPLSEDLC